MELKMRKLEVAHEVEKKNLKLVIKNKCKEKYNKHLNEMQKLFKEEIRNIID